MMKDSPCHVAIAQWKGQAGGKDISKASAQCNIVKTQKLQHKLSVPVLYVVR